MPPVNDQQGNNVFDELFREYFKPLCAYCHFKFGLEVKVAKDAVHSAFVKLLESNFDYALDAPTKTYVYKIVTNICLDLIRHERTVQLHQQKFKKSSSEIEDDEDYAAAELKQLQNDISQAVAELPDQMRQVFELSRYEGLKYAEIADRLQISIKTVETQMSRALAKLRQKLATYLSVYWLLLVLQIFQKNNFFLVGVIFPSSVLMISA